MKDRLVHIINEEIQKLAINPNVSRSSGFSEDLVYLSIDKSYASAYANGQTSSAHAYKFPINNGVLFYICLNEETQHYGGDVWDGGYKDDIIENLIDYKESNTRLDSLTEEVVYGCGIQPEDITPEQINLLVSYFEKDDLSLMSPLEWSAIQERFGGYSEICVKRITANDIIKVEIYQNGKIIKTLKGNHPDDCETIFYHGSPLQYWQHLLDKKVTQEGVADKYAERAFGIPDPTASQDWRARQAMQPKSTMGEYVGDIIDDDFYNYDDDDAGPTTKKLGRVFANPKTLQDFQPNVRAISDDKGNLFVAEVDGNFYHSQMEEAVDRTKYYADRYMQWYRIGSGNSFRVSSSYGSSFDIPLGEDRERQFVEQVRKKHPQYKFAFALST